ISSFSEDLTFGPGSKVRDAGRVVRMSFSLATGRFSGRANDPDGGKPLTFSGVVLENAQTGAGFFSDQTRAGAVVLNPE
ncbi:MAG TPA: hypothetical protein VHH88_13840, partial [Verrucomicrobiae bacterium]|nr:hypothetical protein [Verrucomicrobiae bacterium]